MNVLKFAKIFKRFRSEERGGMALIIGLTLPILVGMLGIGVDVTNWYLAKRQVQTAVDASAMSGALTFSYTDDSNEAQLAAEDSAGRNNFVVGAGRVLTINMPPSSGAYAGDANAVEVIASEMQTLYLAAVVWDFDVAVRARSVATMTPVPGEHCVLGLDEAMAGAVEFTGTADVDMGCGVASNSHDDEAISIWGNAELESTPVSAVGDIVIGGSSVLDTDAPLRSFQTPFDDPYGPEGMNLTAPAYAPPCPNLPPINSDTTLDPGCYRGITVGAGATVTFNPGIYIIDRDDFRAEGGSTLIGDGVMFYLTGTGPNYATVTFTGGTIADLSAPTSGPYEGILFYQDPNAPSSPGGSAILNTNQFLGGSQMELTGALYFPSQEVVFTGGSVVAGTCLQIVARKVTFTGTGVLGNDCPADMTVQEIVSYRVTLVE